MSLCRTLFGGVKVCEEDGDEPGDGQSEARHSFIVQLGLYEECRTWMWSLLARERRLYTVRLMVHVRGWRGLEELIGRVSYVATAGKNE